MTLSTTPSPDVKPILAFAGEFNFLSNFHPCPIWLDGDGYRSLEHAYQAAKTLDRRERDLIRRCPTASQAKKLGQTLHLRPDWNDNLKLSIMLSLLEQKFEFGSPLSIKLLATAPRPLVEGNTWHDNFWGVCYCPKCPGTGKNHLGNLLMQIRTEQSEYSFHPGALL